MNVMEEFFAEITCAPEMIAHHEAGHAVAYAARSVAFRYVTLRPRDRFYGGHVLPYSVLRSSAVDDLLTLHAGPFAERMWLYRTWGMEVDPTFGSALSDSLAIAELCVEFPILNSRYDHYELEAYDLVDQRWPLIKELAARLMVERTVPGPEVHRMYRASLAAGGAR